MRAGCGLWRLACHWRYGCCCVRTCFARFVVCAGAWMLRVLTVERHMHGVRLLVMASALYRQCNDKAVLMQRQCCACVPPACSANCKSIVLQGIFPESHHDRYDAPEALSYSDKQQRAFHDTACRLLHSMLDTMPEHLAPNAVLYFGVAKTKRMAGAGRL